MVVAICLLSNSGNGAGRYDARVDELQSIRVVDVTADVSGVAAIRCSVRGWPDTIFVDIDSKCSG